MISDAIQEKLLDPESARFKWVELVELQPKNYFGPIESRLVGVDYCGLVNSKNTFGGYAGDAPYLVFLTLTKEPLFKAPVLLLFLKLFLSYITKANYSLLLVSVIGIGDANWHSPKLRTLLMMCAKSGYKKLYLAK